MSGCPNISTKQKEELVQVNENMYVIQPHRIAGKTRVFIGNDGVLLVDDQGSMLADYRMKF